MTFEWGLKMIVLYHSSFQWGKVRGEEWQLKLSASCLDINQVKMGIGGPFWEFASLRLSLEDVETCSFKLRT